MVEEWPGAFPVTDEVTPVKIKNNSGDPLRIRYNEFVLITEDGGRYNAISPFRLEGDVKTPRLIDDRDSIEEANFDFDDNFRVVGEIRIIIIDRE